jgi:hypothetical protein
MTDRRRSYIDRHTGEFLLLEWDNQQNGWVPAMHLMQRWQQGNLRIYQPTDCPNTFITLPGFLYWPHLTTEEEADIRQVLAYPWIQDGQAMENLTTDQIYDVEGSLQQLAEESLYSRAQGLLEDILRPTLVMDLPLTLLTVSSAPQPTQPIQMPPPPFPKHLVGSVLAKAEAEGHVCPITMDTIKTTDAYITSCGHIFQQAAIRNWLQTHTTCPECRQPCQ